MERSDFFLSPTNHSLNTLFKYIFLSRTEQVRDNLGSRVWQPWKCIAQISCWRIKLTDSPSCRPSGCTMFTLRLHFSQATLPNDWVQHRIVPALSHRTWDSSKGWLYLEDSLIGLAKMFLGLCYGLKLFLPNPPSFLLSLHRCQTWF